MEIPAQLSFPPNVALTVYTVSRTVYRGNIVGCEDCFLIFKLLEKPHHKKDIAVEDTSSKPLPLPPPPPPPYLPPYAPGQTIRLNIKLIEAIG
jgi:hypothetical protein